MESPENDGAVFRPSHKPWKSLREGTEKRKILRSDSHISSAPRKTARLSRIQNPKGQNPLRLPFASFRLIFRLEKTLSSMCRRRLETIISVLFVYFVASRRRTHP